MNKIRMCKIFTPDECQQIIECGLSLPLIPAYSPGMQINPEIRSSMVRFFYEDQSEYDWIFDKMWNSISELHDQIYKLNFIQFTEYDSAYVGRFTPHRDTDIFYHPTNRTSFIRKVTSVIQLSDPDSYIGGDLRLHLHDDQLIVGQRDRGCAIIFPSDTLHEVTKITSGIRYSLVAWFEGKK